MKQSVLFRLLVVITFCMASLAIKSETSSCKADCYRIHARSLKAIPVISDDNEESINCKSEIFFIKI
jgi:hypothetical protein